MPTRSLSPVAYVYLLLAIAGAIIPWTYNVLAIHQLGRVFSAGEFIGEGFRGSAILGSISADFWIGSTASLIWMIVESLRRKMRWPWAYVVVTFVIAWACALPLFLFMRERHLARAE